MRIKTELPYRGCEVCGAFNPDIQSKRIWEGDRIIGHESTVYCANSMLCAGIRIAIKNERELEKEEKESPEQATKESKKFLRRSKSAE